MRDLNHNLEKWVRKLLSYTIEAFQMIQVIPVDQREKSTLRLSAEMIRHSLRFINSKTIWRKSEKKWLGSPRKWKTSKQVLLEQKMKTQNFKNFLNQFEKFTKTFLESENMSPSWFLCLIQKIWRKSFVLKIITLWHL